MTAELLTLLMGVTVGLGIVAMPWLVIIFVVAPIVLSLRGDDTTPLQKNLEKELEEQKEKVEKQKEKVKKLKELVDKIDETKTESILNEAAELIKQHESQGD